MLARPSHMNWGRVLLCPSPLARLPSREVAHSRKTGPGCRCRREGGRRGPRKRACPWPACSAPARSCGAAATPRWGWSPPSGSGAAVAPPSGPWPWPCCSRRSQSTFAAQTGEGAPKGKPIRWAYTNSKQLKVAATRLQPSYSDLCIFMATSHSCTIMPAQN